MTTDQQRSQDDDQRIVPFKADALTEAESKRLAALESQRSVVVHDQAGNISRGLGEGGIDRVTLLEKIKELHADVDGSVLDCWRKNLPV